MFGFGGIANALFHVVVERRRWLTPEEYASTLGLGQVLPGANLINLTTMVGDRFQGVIGALLALGGLMSMPLLSLIALATLYDRFSDLPDVHSAMLAAAAGAVGLTMGTGIKLARTILKSPVAISFAAASFAAIGLLQFADTADNSGAGATGGGGGILEPASMNRDVLVTMVITFASTALVSVGGIAAMIPEIHRQAVDIYGWMDDAQFATAFAISQIAPGPNILLMSLVGWRVAGLAGLIVATLATVVPTSLIAFAAHRAEVRLLHARWYAVTRRSLPPIVVGLIAARLSAARIAFLR